MLFIVTLGHFRNENIHWSKIIAIRNQRNKLQQEEEKIETTLIDINPKFTTKY